MKSVIFYSHPDYAGPFERINTPDGPRSRYQDTDAQSNTIRALLTSGGIVFTEQRLDEGLMRHRIPYGGKPAVVIDVDGETYKVFPAVSDGVYVHGEFTTALAAAPESAAIETPKPLARIVTKHSTAVADTLFSVGETITLEVEIRTPDDSARLTNFEQMAGQSEFIVWIAGPADSIPICLSFSSGFATKTLAFSAPGAYSAGSNISALVRVVPITITVAL